MVIVPPGERNSLHMCISTTRPTPQHVVPSCYLHLLHLSSPSSQVSLFLSCCSESRGAMLPTWHPLRAAGSGAARPTSARPSSRPKPRPCPNPGPSLSLRTCEPSPWLLWFSPAQPTLPSPLQPAQQPPGPHPANLSPCNPGRPDQFNGPGPPPPPRGGALPRAVPGRPGGLSESHRPRGLKDLPQ